MGRVYYHQSLTELSLRLVASRFNLLMLGKGKLLTCMTSTPDPSGLEQPQFQYCALTNRIRCDVQHVCAARKHHIVKSLSRR